MNVDRISITMDPQLGAAARKAAKRAGISLSAWLTRAAADRIRNEALGRALDQWEAEHGALTADELAAAAKDLRLPRPRKKTR